MRAAPVLLMVSWLACGGVTPTATLPIAPPPADASSPDTPEAAADVTLPDGPPSFTLPFHDGTILRVYGVPTEDAGEPFMDVGFDAKITLARFDPRSHAVTLIGRIGVVGGSNYGGLFIPVGITRDDAHIVLRAHMLPPGAGGGTVDLGYGSIAVRGSGDREVDTIATAHALFLDGYDEVVFVGEGDNTPHNSKPGPSNDATILVRIVGRETPTVLLAEPDTSYTLVSADPHARTVTYDARHFVFSAACPRQDDALACAHSTVKRGTLHVP